MVKISIDWIKAEEKPNRSQRVKGRNLIDLRDKIAELEKQLNKKLKTVEQLSNEMINLSRNITHYYEFVKQLEKELKKNYTLSIETFEEFKEDLIKNLT